MSEPHSSHVDLHNYKHTMTCEEIEKKLYEFIDGRLCLEDINLYRDHLDKCPPCKGFVDFEQKIVSLIREKGGHQGPNRVCLPSTLRAKLQKAIELSKLPPKN